MTLMIHARNCLDIAIYISLVFDHLFSQTIHAGAGELSTLGKVYGPVPLYIIVLTSTVRLCQFITSISLARGTLEGASSDMNTWNARMSDIQKRYNE